MAAHNTDPSQLHDFVRGNKVQVSDTVVDLLTMSADGYVYDIVINNASSTVAYSVRIIKTDSANAHDMTIAVVNVPVNAGVGFANPVSVLRETRIIAACEYDVRGNKIIPIKSGEKLRAICSVANANINVQAHGYNYTKTP